MARYIDADLIKQKLQEKSINDPTTFINTVLIGLLDDAPTADVVPKSEVARLEIELEKARRKYLPSGLQACSEEEAIKIGREYGKADVASEIFAEIEQLVGFCPIENQCAIVSLVEIAELKKKYTEGERS